MSEDTPPTLHLPLQRRGRKIAIVAASVGALLILGLITLVILRLAGLIGVYRLPTASMAPAINSGDGIFVEGVTYLLRHPARGEVIAFRINKASITHEEEKYVKRLVGLPGDRLRITAGTLYVNDQPMPFRNKAGETRYINNVGHYLRSDDDTFTVPADSYFVLGDNSPHSVDSREWGAVPARSVLGRATFCYAPSANAGWIR